jgi:hypothetical protein
MRPELQKKNQFGQRENELLISGSNQKRTNGQIIGT